MNQFHWDPDTYLALMRDEVPDYDRLQSETVAATGGIAAQSILELGIGTGETARRLLDAHPDATLDGIDSSPQMLARARANLARRMIRLHNGRLQDPLPSGPFELVVSALAVHHLDGADKATLFKRVADVLAPGGRFVLADVVVVTDPREAVTPIDDGDYDKPSSVSEQLEWLAEAGLNAHLHWCHRDLAVLVGDLV